MTRQEAEALISAHLESRRTEKDDLRHWYEFVGITVLRPEIDLWRLSFTYKEWMAWKGGDPEMRREKHDTWILDAEGKKVEDRFLHLAEKWVTEVFPGEESLGSHGCGAAHTWGQVDELHDVQSDGDGIVIDFTWSQHRESEFTVYTEGGEESLMSRERTSQRFEKPKND